MLRPHVLIPASFNGDQPPDKYHFNCAYTSAIVTAGGFPIGVMRPDESDIDSLLPTIDGLFLMGGNDIDPREYNEVDHACVLCEPARDRVEFMLIRKAMERHMPILAICRGFQVLNVALGGSLYQDVLKQMPGALQHSYHRDAEHNSLPPDLHAHDVVITPGTQLHALSQSERIGVNSLHHQGIKELGSGLLASAIAPDGLIEAVEIENYPFGIAVEWHPEELHDDTSKRLFDAFIEASKKYHETKKTGRMTCSN